MAELDTSGGGKNKGGKVRSKKQSTRVDLTAMVDLAFLLITFFMLTTTLAKPQAMDLAMPDKEKQDQQELTIADNRTMTILLGANNRLEWYMGLVDKPLTPPQVDNYGRNGIRKALVENAKKVIAATGDPSKGLIVLIKPSDQSNYRNFVDILDEMKVSNIDRYAIVEISDPDIELLKRDGIYK
ncbi:MAG: biopolymer transporter ExbD [Sphingobacteriales bacterium 17-39-43]|uniref:ExbD/TolR family protein n=1 Tax=Daejeonella sp. TaxID=2805397 RepID=UPI000BD01206|nr:biopolymer transporter ExbD [Daejeonella sp.]OYZ28132.1 MAG: biopolymer transporter ExbD [Sphingobacteriales bacterium 16-39-50]OZA21864.1 MAG: biopolymer transporter ExbD [Sphingobacteriales bacterium 17-39-43]HQT24376.1 biopolymer transporter ExbD [Daejeonella sp.]HQT59023.1 biopolymer transporter ExbD [Daejeonella sp.]